MCFPVFLSWRYICYIVTYIRECYTQETSFIFEPANHLTPLHDRYVYQKDNTLCMGTVDRSVVYHAWPSFDNLCTNMLNAYANTV